MQIEELKEIGHDYRYRDQLMVQEFYFSVAVAAVIAGLAAKDVHGLPSIIIQFYGLLFLALITLHLRNINEDRRLAGDRKNELIGALGFFQPHRGIAKDRSFPPISAPRNMVRFAILLTIGWALWLTQSGVALIGFKL